MTRKNSIILAVALIALGLVYWNLYKDAFGKKVIQISYTTRTRNGNFGRRKPASASPTLQDEPDMTLNFGLDQKYKLTSIKVVSEAKLATNKYAQPLWFMVSDPNSPPQMAFIYGGRIRGMRPSVKGAEAEPLQTGVPYHIFVEAGKIHGDHVFKIGEAQTNAPAPEASGN